ncbi:MAG: hydrogenase nickel incorporation protein HypB [Xanthomonadales bacterium]|nr:hydrogenase nickel incorporation protein HypB [Xanthomonadales bacterium]
MCTDCGCGLPEHQHHAHPEIVDVMTPLLAENDRVAAHNREHFDRAGVLAINLMSSPGAGKTALLEATIERLGGECRIAVVEGDLETENDAVRIRRLGVPAVQICTTTTCHLDATMLHRALHELDLAEIDLLFVENVGNLVCPASFDLGQHLNVTLLSTTEGDDKPAKYPVMFRAADLVLISKSDLIEVLDDFDVAAATEALRGLGSSATVLETAARRAVAVEPWLNWLRARLSDRRSQKPVAVAE